MRDARVATVQCEPDSRIPRAKPWCVEAKPALHARRLGRLRRAGHHLVEHAVDVESPATGELRKHDGDGVAKGSRMVRILGCLDRSEHRDPAKEPRFQPSPIVRIAPDGTPAASRPPLGHCSQGQSVLRRTSDVSRDVQPEVSPCRAVPATILGHATREGSRQAPPPRRWPPPPTRQPHPVS